MTAIKLHIGAQSKADGWTTFAMEPGPHVDHVGAYNDLSVFSGESVEVIYACHILQRFPYQEIRAVLKEWLRVLRPGGEVLISVPDMRLLCWQFLRDDFDPATRFNVMRMLFGGQTLPGDFSLAGLTFEFLQTLLREAGFEATQRVDSLGVFADVSDFIFRDFPVNLNVRAHKPPAPAATPGSAPAELSFGAMQSEWHDTMVLRNVARLASVKTIVDLGSADGHFSLLYFELFKRPAIVNVDANPLYESSLKAIAEATRGHYLIAAVTDQDGEIEITEGAHAYWDSVRPPADDYWKSINDLTIGKRRVRSLTLDTLAKEFSLPRPYLLKLDIQGAEELALKGGKEFLSHTSVVICEVAVPDFARIHSVLTEADFALFDFILVNRMTTGQLGWFYPIYLPRRHAAFTAESLWHGDDNARMLNRQAERREQVLRMNEVLLAAHRPTLAET